jgi:hypothetical protein
MYSVFGSEVARIEVGPDREPFTIHVELLCFRSPFFRKALKGPFQEAQTRVMPMPDDDVDAFSRFELWLYNNYLRGKSHRVQPRLKSFLGPMIVVANIYFSHSR